MIDTTQKDMTPTVRELRKLADEHHEVVDEAARWAAEWSKPKTLREIHALVGRFPFKAKAVIESPIITLHPPGTVAECVGVVMLFDGRVLISTPEFPMTIGRKNLVGIDQDIARWVLVED